MKKDILFVHGRPAGHPLHAKYGRAITSNFSFEDPLIRWHDRSYAAITRYLAWMVNSFSFTSFKRKIIVTECLRVTLVISKIISFNKIKLVMLVADESPYFLFSNYYGRLSKLFNRWAYNQYDAFICIGEMEAYLVRATLNNPSKKILRTTINGVSEEKLSRLKEKSYDIHSNRIVFIGSGPANWRVWYKGLDVMLQAFKKYSALNPQATFEIAGDWDQESIVTYLGENSDRIKFLGHVKNIEEFLEGAALYLHIGRGDAWPIAIMESMAAGIIPVVSEWTGAKECVAQVSPDLIVKVDVDEVFKKMNWFFEISGTERLKLSTRCKEIASLYPEQKAISRFKECFDSIESKLI